MREQDNTQEAHEGSGRDIPSQETLEEILEEYGEETDQDESGDEWDAIDSDTPLIQARFTAHTGDFLAAGRLLERNNGTITMRLIQVGLLLFLAADFVTQGLKASERPGLMFVMAALMAGAAGLVIYYPKRTLKRFAESAAGDEGIVLDAVITKRQFKVTGDGYNSAVPFSERGASVVEDGTYLCASDKKGRLLFVPKKDIGESRLRLTRKIFYTTASLRYKNVN